MVNFSPIQSFSYTQSSLGIKSELKMIYHPDGVIRPTPPEADNETEFVYDYFIKDYLGNVRVVLTEENAYYTEKFLSTLEEAHREIEERNFDNVGETAEDLPTGYPVDGSAELNEKIALLSAANGTEIGPSIVMPVRRGDQVSLRTDYFYTEDAPGATYDSLNMLVNEVLLALAASGSGVLRLTEGQLIDLAAGGNQYSTAIGSFFSSSFDTTDVSKPFGYLVWMLYDNDMNLLPAGSGAKRVTDPNELKDLLEENIPVGQDGYLHAYVSNGSASNVSFDNFLITYMRGQTRQINHYYPYGLSIDGLDHSDEYLNKYTSKELQTGEFFSQTSSGLEMFDFGSRFYDPQVGRWFTPDPAEQFHNPYLAMGNNPVMYVDPNGEFVITTAIIIGAMIGSFTGAVAAGYSGASNGQIMASFGVGALAGAIGGAMGQGVSGAIQGAGFWPPVLGQVSLRPVSGFLTGAAVGGSSGGSSGFVSGFGSAGIQGANIGDMLSQGLEYGWKGAAAGGLLGGVSGGLDAVSNNDNFFTGKPGFQKKLDYLLSESDPYLQRHFDKALIEKTKIRGWNGDYKKGEFAYTSARGTSSGSSYLGYKGYNAKIRISRSLVNDFYRDYLVDGPATILHEFYHARDFSSGLETFFYFSNYSEDFSYISEINAYNFEYSIFQNANALIGRRENVQLYFDFIQGLR